ncbi:hypothetical protein ATCC90586_002453 [Pythium insidiosum]|nr:hypothetical protein ATCC90586_002453 [Pythium insidiosum]
MFKPAEEERFVRDGIAPGEGAVREEAAYVLDSRSGGFSGVPPTAVAKIHLASIGRAKHGAVQRFMMGSIGSMEGFGMSYDLAKAAAFVPVEQVHRIGLLDIRTFNTDRHPGNILLIGDKPPYTMVPIDHGCILPSWFHLSEARFDWLDYPQSKVPFSSQALEYVAEIDVEADAAALRKLGIREECVTTMRICVLFLKLAKSQVVHGILGRRPPRLFFANLERILSREVQHLNFASNMAPPASTASRFVRFDAALEDSDQTLVFSSHRARGSLSARWGRERDGNARGQAASSFFPDSTDDDATQARRRRLPQETAAAAGRATIERSGPVPPVSMVSTIDIQFPLTRRVLWKQAPTAS